MVPKIADTGTWTEDFTQVFIKFTIVLFFSGKTETVKVILEAGAKVDVTNSVGRNASQMAAFVGEWQCVCNSHGLNDLA